MKNMATYKKDLPVAKPQVKSHAYRFLFVGAFIIIGTAVDLSNYF